MKIRDWTIERGDKVLNAEWIARHPSDSKVSCWLDGRNLILQDDTRYYPGGSFEVPLAVIEALQARQAP